MKISSSGTFFVLSLCFFSFSYGVASVHYRLWPHPVLEQAKEALDAYLVAINEELEAKPAEFTKFEDENFTGPTVRVSRNNAGAGNEYIFMDGGHEQLTTHCRDFGCLAWIMDRDGKIIHTWSADPEVVWDKLDQVEGFGSAENRYSVGAH